MSNQHHTTAVGENVVQRLRMKIRQARAMGFQVRQEMLGDQPAAWCEIGGRKVLFIDAAQPAREQIATIDEAIATYRPAK